ncbi:DUF5686 family protein [Weeksellaceae bacterium A-14]
MKQLFSLALLLICLSYSGQSKITVYRSGDRSVLAGAAVYCNGVWLGNTNTEGVLNFKTKCRKVDVSAHGFYSDEAVVDKVMEIALSPEDPDVKTIETVVLQDKSDPEALALLDKVDARYEDNSPRSLDSYSFRSYEKISYDFDEDSIRAYNRFLDKRMDSLRTLPSRSQTAEVAKDSLEALNVNRLMGQSKLFLWERAQEFLYSRKYGEKIEVLDNRVSGLKQPLYEMMAMRSNRTRMPREIQRENRNLYRYYLTDSIDIEGRKNYVVRFRQVDYKQPVRKRKFNGYLYIDAQTYALKKLESQSKIKSEGSITSIWKPIDGKWFLTKENFKIRAGYVNFEDKKLEDSIRTRKRFGTYVFLSSDYFDFKIPAQATRKDFRGYTIDVQNSDGKLLGDFRTVPLTQREENTYAKMDSIGVKYRVDQKANVLSGLLRGKVRFGNVDFDLSQLLKYNLYEGLRLGAAFRLNENFNRYISPDAYLAYGFKDGGFKYGAGVEVKTTTHKTSFFRAEYYSDVIASGKFSENMWNFRMKLMNSGVDMKNDRFYHYEGFKLSYENDLTNTLTMRVSAKKDREESRFEYDFLGRGNRFDNFSTLLTLKYSPNSKNIMTPDGKFTYEQNFPEFYLNYEKAFASLGGDLKYDRFDFLAAHQLKWSAGTTGIRAFAGLMSGEVPIWHHFQMNGLGSGKENSLNFNLTSYLGFATMEAGRYYSDRFAGFYLTHRIPWYFKSIGKNISSFDLVYRGVIGNMKHPEYHGLDFGTLDHLYQEAGLEWNNFLSSQFNLGFFYRIGYYNAGTFKDNFAIQFKFKFLGF